MIAAIKPSKISIYLNKQRKSLSEIKKETGADFIINGGFYNMTTFEPVGVLCVDGNTLVYEWNAEGYGFDEDGITFSWSNVTRHKNFIYGVVLISDNIKRAKLEYPGEVAGARQRTAMGLTAEGMLVLYCSQSGSTPEQLRDAMYNLGCVNAIMLDGGGSTQCDFDGDCLKSSRNVQNFICVWTDEESVKKDDEPTLIKKGSKGEAVKALQHKLNQFAFNLVEDGDFGSGTEKAVIAMQKALGLTADGIVGDKTNEATAYVLSLLNKSETVQDKLVSYAISFLGTSEPDGDNQFISAFNKASGFNFNLNVSWCQIFVWYCLAHCGIDKPITASCTQAITYFKSIGAFKDKPSKGDLIYFDWDKSGDCDHVGIVVDVSADSVTTVEGNSADSVKLNSYKLNNSTIYGYAYPFNFSESKGCFTICFGSKSEAEEFASLLSKYPSVYVKGEND